MLPLLPILILAYGALYALAFAIPRGCVELSVVDAIATPSPAPFRMNSPALEKSIMAQAVLD